MEFLNSVGAVVKDGPKRSAVDPWKEWSPEDWDRYNAMMATLASGNGGLNLPTGRIGCGEGDQEVNQFCDQWDCIGRAKLEERQREEPDGFFIVSA